MKYKFLATILFTLLTWTWTKGQDQPAVYILDGSDKIEIIISQNKAPSGTFVHQYAGDIHSYSLSEVRDPEELRKEIASDLEKIKAIPNPDERQARLEAYITHLNQGPLNLVKAGSIPIVKAGAQDITLQLDQPLSYKKTYQLKIKGLDLSSKPRQSKEPELIAVETKVPAEVPETKVTVQIPDKPTADLLPPINAYDQNEVRVTSITPLRASADLKVESRTLRLKSDLTGFSEEFEDMMATKSSDTGTLTSNEIAFKLKERLNGGKTYDLIIRKGLTDDRGKPVTVSGILKIPGAPPTPDTAKVDITFSSVAAVHQKGVLDLAGNIVPTKPMIIGGSSWYWEPKISLDLGLRSTKSANSIIVGLPFTHYFYFSNVRKVAFSTPYPKYAGWSQTPWYSLSDIKFYLGPRIETDRTFHRFNVLGEARFDLDFHRWLGSISDRRGLLKRDLSDQDNVKKENKSDSDLIELNFGLRLIPYLSFDFGEHANNETVTNAKKKMSEIVPRYAIFRTYPGIVGTIEWRTFSLPTTLTLDESVVYLATTEQIGYTTDTGVGLRVLRGFHPHFKNSLDFALDPAKHYSFNLTYENGRLAPNFEYLNKITAGIKVKFGSADKP